MPFVLIVDYSKEERNVHISTAGATGALYNVSTENVARDIGYAVECYVQDYVEAGEL